MDDDNQLPNNRGNENGQEGEDEVNYDGQMEVEADDGAMDYDYVVGHIINARPDSDSDDESTRTTEGKKSKFEHNFQTDLPAKHEYLGKLEEVKGRTVLEDNDIIKIPILQNSGLHMILLPNQVVPITVFHTLDKTLIKKIVDGNKLFGIIHTSVSSHGSSPLYGTTAEIFEYMAEEQSNSVHVKAKGRQRFLVKELYQEVAGGVIATVKILPEKTIGNPFFGIEDCFYTKTGSTLRSSDLFSDKEALRSVTRWKHRQRIALQTRWPLWVYEQYDDELLALRLIEAIHATLDLDLTRIRIPSDPQELSHWASVNLPLETAQRLKLLSMNTPTERLQYILSAYVYAKVRKLVCKRCHAALANTTDIFSMSVEGPHGTFVNPGGYIHEMFTLKKARSLSLYGPASTAHSWFPGYAWTITNCLRCRHHVGWKFTATKSKLKPSKFYGLTRSSVVVKYVPEDGSEREAEQTA